MKKRRFKNIIAFLMLVVVFTMSFDIPVNLKVMAADDDADDTNRPQVEIRCGNDIVTSIELYAQERKRLQCMVNGEVVSDEYECEWIIQNGENCVELRDEGGNAIAATGTAVKAPFVYAKEIGTAEIILTVKNKTTGTTYNQALLNVTVKKKTLLINKAKTEDKNFQFEYIYKDDEIPALMIAPDDTGNYGSGELKLIEGADLEGITWESKNEDIVTISKADNGIVIAKGIGAGHTTIVAQNGTGDRDTIDVYVQPNITVSGNKGSRFDINSGDVLETGINYVHNATQVLTDRISWVVYKFGNNSEKIFVRDSFGNVGEEPEVFRMAEVDGTPAKNLQVTANSGQYQVCFYPEGIYTGTQNSGTGNNNTDNQSDIEPIAINLNVVNKRPNSDLTLNIGDAYNVASALNITVSELKEWFVAQSVDTSILSYDANTAELKALGITNNAVPFAFTPVPQSYDKIRSVLGEDIANNGFTFNVRVIDYFSLNSKVSLKVGDTLQLLPNYSNKPEYNYEWSSSDPNTVSVTQEGWITALKTTTNDVIITVSLKQNNQVIKRATCSVKVTTIDSTITLNKAETSINVGDTERIIASITPSTSDGVIHWSIGDERIAKIAENLEGKYVDVTGVGTGTTTLVAMNSDNYVLAFCKITVVQYATGITLDQTQLTVKLNREVVRLKAVLAPANTTSTDLVWTSTDTSIATVDETGLVTLKRAGTTYITVQPKESISDQIRAECRLTVVQSSTSLTFAEKEMSLSVGEQKEIKYTLLPENSTSVITWNSLDTSIASVNNTGMVTAVKVGQTYITAVTEEGYVASCLIKVTQQATGIILDVTDLTLDVGDTYAVKYTLQPVHSTETSLIWTSQNEEIATVDLEGRITGVSQGTTTIFVKTKSGNVEYVFVTVRQSVKGLTLDTTSKKIEKGESFTLKPIFSPTTVTNTNVTWKSSDTGVVTVSEEGKVEGIGAGAAVVTCISEDGKLEANCVVTVIEIIEITPVPTATITPTEKPVTTIKLNKSSYTLGVGKSITLKATVKSTKSKKVKWTSSNTSIAKVNASGKVTGKKVGKCTITAKTTDGSGKTAKCTITVVRQATSVKLNKMYLKMYVGASYKLKATIKPKNVTKKSLSWSSSNKDVALVGSGGKVVALSAGRSTITVKTKDNSNKKAKCVIDVIERVPITDITATETSVVMVKGTSQNVAFNISPSNTTDKVTYSSDNSYVATINDDGTVKARNTGIAVITAKGTSGKSATITITVVGLNKTSVTLEQYSTDQLWIEDDTNLTVRWSSENSEIARVDSSGNITARRFGTTRIIATVKGVKLYCTVRVIPIPNTY